MSIVVEIQKLTPRQHDLPDEIKVDMLNEMAEDFAEEVAKALGELKCDRHQDEVSHIIIIADRNHTMSIRKKCCCDDFEKLIDHRLAR